MTGAGAVKTGLLRMYQRTHLPLRVRRGGSSPRHRYLTPRSARALHTLSHTHTHSRTLISPRAERHRLLWDRCTKHGCTCLVLLACHLFHLCRQRRGKTQRGTGGLLIFVEPLLPGPATGQSSCRHWPGGFYCSRRLLQDSTCWGSDALFRWKDEMSGVAVEPACHGPMLACQVRKAAGHRSSITKQARISVAPALQSGLMVITHSSASRRGSDGEASFPRSPLMALGGSSQLCLVPSTPHSAGLIIHTTDGSPQLCHASWFR
ncbi:hypothetical protein EDB80DRAFT_100137 [Ilyonectria destructans]|nr:hypothetical protein EDB80DRAFT_100137 [Ilyonectria destructans]